MGGPLPIGGAAELDLNGASDKLILDADADTTISADTDDQIDFKTGGTDRLKVQSTSGNNVVVADGLTLTDGNLIVASGHGIDFSATGDGSGTTTSELLDDYEEGTFTPSFSGASGAPSGVNYSYRTASYTKIGRLVTCHIYMALSSWSSGPSGDMIVTGLPFTCRNNTDSYAAANVGYCDGFTSSDAPQTGYVPINATKINMQTNQSSDGRDDLRTPANAGNMSGDETIIISTSYHTDA
jgi:hypothetical protein